MNKIILIGILTSMLSGYSGSIFNSDLQVSSKNVSTIFLAEDSWFTEELVFENGFSTVKLVNGRNKNSSISIVNSYSDIDEYDRKLYVESISGFSTYNKKYFHSKGVEGDFNVELFSWREEGYYNQVTFVDKDKNTSIIIYHLDNDCNMPTFSEILKYVNC